MDNLISSTQAESGRVGLKAAALFLVGFLTVVAALFVWDVFSSMPSSVQEGGAPTDAAAIDAKLESELRKAVDFNGFDVPTDVKDPFTDRGGLSEAANAQGVGASGATAGAAPGAGTGSGTGSATEAPIADPVADTKARFDAWMKAFNSGRNPGRVETVLSINEIVPLGYSSGGAEGEKVILYSPALCMTFKVSLGSKLFDGWLVSRRGSQVLFMGLDKKPVDPMPILASKPKSQCSEGKTGGGS